MKRTGNLLAMAVAAAVLPLVLAAQAPPRKSPRPAAKLPAKTSPAAAAEAPPIKYKGIFEPVNYSEDIQLHDVFFVSAEVGWVSGASGTILKTTDGGANWTAQLGGDPQSTDQAIAQLKFLDERTGWARQNEKLLRTTDGETWEQAGTLRQHAYDFLFTSESNGVYLGFGKDIFHTRDGGRTWKITGECQARAEIAGLMRNLTCETNLLQFVSPSVGFAVGFSRDVTAAVVMKTEDGGETWNAAGVLENESSRRGGMFFLDETTGFLLAYSDHAFRSTDGSQTWKPLLNTTLGSRIRFADPEVGWSFAGADPVTFSWTTDGGKRWSSRQLRFPAAVHAFSLPRRDRAYVVGDHGMIYRYRVVPETEMVSKAIDAPAMPGVAAALDAQAAQLETQLAAIEQAVDKAQKSGGAAASDAPSAKPEGAAAEGAGWVEENLPEQVNELASTVDSLSAEIPQFTGKYRNLNLIFTGLKLVGELFAQAQGVQDSFRNLRKARDLASVATALAELHGQVDTIKSSVKTALQKPQ